MEHESSRLSLLVESTEVVGEIFDVFGVGVIVIGIVVATILFLRAIFKGAAPVDAINTFKVRIGRAMLLGLEVLIAADIVKTVAVSVTISNMAALGVLVLVRTFLSWTLELEIEGRWPWQATTDVVDPQA